MVSFISCCLCSWALALSPITVCSSFTVSATYLLTFCLVLLITAISIIWTSKPPSTAFFFHDHIICDSLRPRQPTRCSDTIRPDTQRARAGRPPTLSLRNTRTCARQGERGLYTHNRARHGGSAMDRLYTRRFQGCYVAAWCSVEPEQDSTTQDDGNKTQTDTRLIQYHACPSHSCQVKMMLS